MNAPIPYLLLALVVGALVTLTDPLAATDQDADILYWVAPMDPNYRRDSPGKSPMGMALLPVYADQSGATDAMVRIDPAVVQNLGVRTAVVKRGPLPQRIATVGYVAFDEDGIGHVHLRTGGWIEKLYVKSNGERVKRGDPLFELYSPDLVNAQEEYLQSLRGQNAALQQASRERLAALGVSARQIDQITAQRRVSQRVDIDAGHAGFVDGLKIREGMFVTPATEIMTLVDLSSVWVLVDVFERQSGRVAAGQPAEVRLRYAPGRVWKGEVDYVYPTVDPRTRTLRVRLRFDNPDETLKPNMYASVTIDAGQTQEVLQIPREALIKTGGAPRVIIALGEGRFSPREVVAGIESGDVVEIRHGLSEGEQIVTSAQFLIDSEASLKAGLKHMSEPDATPATATHGDLAP